MIARLFANENIPRSLVLRLRQLGHDVLTVHEAGMTGAVDVAIVERAASEKRTILTQDLDFGRIFIERDPPVRILVLRSPDARGPALTALVEAFLKRVDLDAPANAEGLFVIGPRGHRHRKRAS
ncbi:MAG TPA: DUF5615 family PIN-like protein [Candidatus Thermoplasmatota archaeon]|nr:DUF5615 family PIN-like protein [Candidatus Thermoplasmatota archaeon]